MPRAGSVRPSLEGLERRALLTASSRSSQAAVVKHDLDQYASDLQRVELASQATPAEYLALRDDARAISAAASASDVSRSGADARAVAVTLLLDRSMLYGSLGASGWADVRSRLTANLDGLGVAPALVDRTVADMQVAADSAGVSAANLQTILTDIDRYAEARAHLGTASSSGTGQATSSSSGTVWQYNFPDAQVYYTQHLRGFFRGFATGKRQAEAALRADLRAVPAGAGAAPADASALRRDVSILESLGAAVPSVAGGRIDDAFAAAVSQGPAAASTFQGAVIAALGPAATPARTAQVARLASDLPAASRAVGGASAGLRTVVTDLRGVVDAGGGSTLNPFRVTVFPAPRPNPNG